MTNLPDDFKSWPHDPFELLDLKRTVDARTAKRAYYKLVRKYKPDRFPVEFQKIRDAYEAVQGWLSWQDGHADDDESTSEVSGDTNDQSAQMTTDDWDLGRNEFAGVVNQASKLLDNDPIELFFESLKTEGVKTAVSHLENAGSAKDSSQVAKASLLKYFIGRFYPKTMNRSLPETGEDRVPGVPEADLKRIGWLLESLDSSETADAAMAQLRFEFDRNYRLASSKTVNDYLAKVKDFGSFARLFKLRWEAIGHHQPWRVVDDVKALQSRSLEFGGYRGDWMSLLTESMNYTVWQRDDKCMAHTDTCWQEISTNDQSWTADSTELLMLASKDWFEMRGSERGWMAAIPWARNTLPETKRAIWMPVAKEIADDPVGSLNGLDYRFRVHSMAMTIFEEGLQNLADLEVDSETVDEMPWERTRELVACFLVELGTNDYAESRIPIMEFCALNQVALMTFAAAANTFVSEQDGDSWLGLVQRDAPLRCVVNACHITNW